VVENEHVALPPLADRLSGRGLARGTKGVEVADVRLVLEDEQLRDRVQIEGGLSLDQSSERRPQNPSSSKTSPSTGRRRRNGSVFTSAPPTPSASRSTKSIVRSSCS
jgi:hypothetical protein